jgi:hypothetical protein
LQIIYQDKSLTLIVARDGFDNYSLLPTLKSEGIKSQSIELAKKIGSKSNYVKKLLVGYKVYEIIKDNNFYKIPQLNETTYHFNT